MLNTLDLINKKLKYIGQGAFGVVYSTTKIGSDVEVAVKNKLFSDHVRDGRLRWVVIVNATTVRDRAERCYGISGSNKDGRTDSRNRKPKQVHGGQLRLHLQEWTQQHKAYLGFRIVRFFQEREDAVLALDYLYCRGKSKRSEGTDSGFDSKVDSGVDSGTRIGRESIKSENRSESVLGGTTSESPILASILDFDGQTAHQNRCLNRQLNRFGNGSVKVDFDS
ncbi:hypothetical protein B0H19DRAFT_1074948 [Mycena capillaripes]|nr:hypothetical protein B0H19DRAFT_1074948 [Mycena capillaripes]